MQYIHCRSVYYLLLKHTAMNNLRIISVSLILTILLSACVPSLHPIYTDKDLVFDKELVGTWVSDGETWVFKSIDDKYYELIYSDTNKKSSKENDGIGKILPNSAGTSAKFDAHLVKLGEEIYLDLFPDNSQFEQNTLLLLHIFPCHTFMKVRIENDKFSYQMFSGDWFKKSIEKNPEILSHEKVDDSYLITASTSELQEFILKYTDSEKMFEQNEILNRK